MPRNKTDKGAEASAQGPFAAYWHALDVEKIFNQQVDLLKTFGAIAAGSSDIVEDKKDRRFDDEVWRTNPLYSRLKQSYLAISDAIEKAVPENLPHDEKARADLAASIVSSAISPTNTLIGNPAALSRTFGTGGQNLAKGLRNLLQDVADNGGMPTQVDTSGFEVGSNLAVTPGKVILRSELFELIHYAPATESVAAVPVLLIPPQIGRYYFTDLSPGRSFAEYTVAQGLQYFAISWRNPRPADRDWGLERYLASAIEAVEAIRSVAGQDKVNLVGFCAGGILSTILLGYLKSQGKDWINSFTLCVTMLDFAADASIGAFRLPAALEMAEAKSSRAGVLRGEDLGRLFTWLRPNELVWNYWVNNYLMGEDPPAFDILAWNNDSTNMPAKLHQDFLAIFRTNALVAASGYAIAGERIDIGRIGCDAFVVGAVTDHLTPWKACYRTAQMLDAPTTFVLSNGGHVAALVNPPGNPKAFHWLGDELPADADAWLEATEKRPGSWWESWTDWCAERSGPRVPAPQELGSGDYLPLADAPGDYVREPSNRR